jgi:heme-degrading monooxygenase HmoA
MIVEHAVITIIPGREAAFEEAFARAPAIFERAEGFGWIRLLRSIEEPSRYTILVGWETVEDHTVRFKESGLWAQWRALVGEFFAAPPTVEHCAVLRREGDETCTG